MSPPPGGKRRSRWADNNALDALVWLILEDTTIATATSSKRKRPCLPTALYSSHIASFLRFEEPVPLLYALGGRQGDPQTTSTKLAAVEVFDSWSSKWRSLPPMSTNRVGAAACPIGKYGVFVAGGYAENPSDPLRSVEEYDPLCPEHPGTDGKWKSLAPMKQKRYGLVVLRAPSDDIYAIGGSSGSEVCSIVERYIPRKDRWVTCASLPEPLAGGRGVEVNGRLLYVGGFIPNGRLSNRIYIYDPLTDTWTVSKVQLRLPRTTFAMAVDTEKGFLIVAGGQAPSHMFQDMWYHGIVDHFAVSDHVEELSLKDIFGGDFEVSTPSRSRNVPKLSLPCLPKNRTGCLGTFMKDHGFIVLGGEEEGAAPIRPNWISDRHSKEWKEAIVLNRGCWKDTFPQPNQPRVAFGLVQTVGFPKITS